MTTRRGLVEAYSFNRRRLVDAFVSGALGGREIDRARPGRTIAGGLALLVLLLAGAAILRILSPSLPEEWPWAQVKPVETAQVTGPGR